MKKLYSWIRISYLIASFLLISLFVNPTVFAASDYNWTNSTAGTPSTNQSWTSIATSSTGQYVIAVADNEDIWTSDNYGGTWINQTSGTSLSGLHWSAVASDSTGQYLVAATTEGIWTSSNYGISWMQTINIGMPGVGVNGVDWSSIASSSSGQYIVAVSNGGDIWTSNNYGANWVDESLVNPSALELRNWFSVTSNTTGQYLAAVNQEGGLWTSDDYGGTWVLDAPIGAWFGIASDSTGQRLIAVSYGGTRGLYTSSNEGTNWTASTSPVISGKYFTSVASNSSGQTLIATADASDIFVSHDYGSTWIDDSLGNSGLTNQRWTAVASSSSGQYVYAVDGSDIWTSNDPALAPPTTDSNLTTQSSTPNNTPGSPDTGFGTYKSDATTNIAIYSLIVTSLLVILTGLRKLAKTR